MSQATPAEVLVERIQAAIVYCRQETDATYGDVIAALECAKLETWENMKADAEEEEDSAEGGVA